MCSRNIKFKIIDFIIIERIQFYTYNIKNFNIIILFNNI